MLLATHQAEITAILNRYASKRSAVLPLLYLAQDTYGHLTPAAVREVATILDLPPTDVFEVVGFYTLYYDKPVGTWMLQVCDDVPCCYLGAEELLTALKQTLGIREEQTTADGLFTLQRVKCLAACDRAPVVQANLDYLYDVTAERADTMLNELRARASEAKRRGVSGRFAEDFAVAEREVIHLPRDGAYQQREFVIEGAPPPPPPTPPAEMSAGHDRPQNRKASPL
ncbi:MAG: complex I 24 kDa subunit family protein [Oscillochloridaceae bacterium umkhey_bin13]